MYRRGRKSYQHGNYIRPSYVEVWREARQLAAENHVSLSEFVSHALYVFMTGQDPEDGKLTGDTREAVVSLERLQQDARASNRSMRRRRQMKVYE